MPPFIPDQADEDMADYGVPFPGFGAADDFDEPVNVVSDLLGEPEVEPTVVALPEVPEEAQQQEQAPRQQAPAVATAVQLDLHVEERVVSGLLYREMVGEDDEVEEDDYYSQDEEAPGSPPHAPVADMELDDGELAGDELPKAALAEPVSVKKRGRPSMSAGKTPSKTPSKSTPATKNSTVGRSAASRSTGRKRKVDELDEVDEEPAAEATPAKKRGRPAAVKTGAASAASARLAAKAAKAPKRGRPAGRSAGFSSETKSDTEGPKRGPGRPKGAAANSTTSAKKPSKQSKKEEVPEGEYEVEEILDSAIDADSLEHLYHVKWKGYPLDEATWEPKINLGHAAELIRAFDAKKNKRTRAPNGTAASKATKAKKAAAPTTVKKTAAAAAPAKKAGRPAGRPRKSAAPAVAAVSKSKSKEVKKPGKPGRPSKGAVKKAPGRPLAAAGARRSARGQA